MSASRTPREEVLRRCFELPWRDFYEVWRVIGSYLEPAGARETKVSKQLRERAEALDCLRRAAEHHNLRTGEGEAPTIEQYEEARAALGLPLTRRQVELRWEGWHFAKLALIGERPVETAAQRSIRRAASGRRRNYEEYLTGVRDWLKTKPPSRTRKDYDAWVKPRNEVSQERPVVLAVAIEGSLILNWARVLQVAEFEMDLDEAQQLRLDELTAASGPLRLIGTVGIALIYKTGRFHVGNLARRPGFPPPVARLGSAQVWYRKDIEAHRAGRKVRRRPGELQERLVDSAEYARRTGMTQATIHGMVHNRMPTLLRPAGSVAGRTFWLRDDFEAWLAQRPRPKRRKRDAKDPSEGV
jgi:predicted DNA-binding transcriptional regulator AlpA